jgi:hypothetical protein
MDSGTSFVCTVHGAASATVHPVCLQVAYQPCSCSHLQPADRPCGRLLPPLQATPATWATRSGTGCSTWHRRPAAGWPPPSSTTPTAGTTPSGAPP